MNLKNFLKEGIVKQALDIPEPDVGGDYPPEKVKRYMEMIDKALEAMKSKDNNDANDAIVADLRDKKKKWGSVDKETKPTKTKTEIPPEQRQDDDPDVQNPPPAEEEPPPEEKPKDEEPPPEEDEKDKDKKKKKKVPPQFQKKEEYEYRLMTPFEKAMKEQEDPDTGKRCYVFHRDTDGKKKRKNKRMRKAMEEGIFDKRMASMKADIQKKYGKSGGKLVDKIYNQLMKIPEFKNLSMDRQGEISIAVQKMIGR